MDTRARILPRTLTIRHRDLNADFTKYLAYRDRPGLVASLTQRQRQVMDLISFGLSNKEIALVMGITEATVKVHCRNISDILGASSRTQIMFIGLTGQTVLDDNGNFREVRLKGLGMTPDPGLVKMIAYGLTDNQIGAATGWTIFKVKSRVRLAVSPYGKKRQGAAFFAITGTAPVPWTKLAASYRQVQPDQRNDIFR